MRPEVRAEYAEVRARLEGDAEFLTRLERFFTELRDPLAALYGDDPRFPAQFAALLDAIAATAALARSGPPPAGPRARDHAGLAAARAGGRLRLLRRPLRRHAGGRARAAAVRARAGRQLPAPDAAAGRAPGAQRRRLRGRGLRRRRAGARHDGRPARAGRRSARRRHGAVRRRRPQPHRARARVGARQAGVLPHVPGPLRARRVRAHAARGLPRHRPRQLLVGPRARALGVDDVQRVSVGPRLHEPRGVRRDVAGRARPRQRRRRRPAPGRRAVPVEAQGHRLPEPARGPPAAAGAPRGGPDRRPGRRVQGGGDRRPGPARDLSRDGPARGQGVRPRLQQRADGADVERAGVRPRGADDPRAGRHAGRAGGRRLGHLRALPRRHRLDDHARGRGGRGRGRAPAPELPVGLLRRRLPRRRSPAARASSPTTPRARRARAG